MTDLPFPKGFRDMLPNESLFRLNVIKKIESVFQLYGFLSINTPKLESLDILLAKDSIGEENKLIFKLKEENLGLRYDQTVSLARYFIMHSDLPLPFKRYSIGEVWRMDEPQRLRYREFTQADIDIIGGESIKGNAEVIAVLSKVYTSFNIDFSVSVNDRSLLDKFFEKIEVTGNDQIKVMRSIDKMDKIGVEGVRKIIEELIGKEKSSKIIELISFEGSNEQKIDFISKIVGEDATREINETLKLLKIYNIKENIILDFSTVRGIDYYTSIVFEFKIKGENSSLGGGGRYDHLIEMYGGKSINAVGASIGVDRLLDILNFKNSKEYSPSQVFIANVKKENYNYALSVANELRANGINTDLNASERNISNQLSYANSLHFKYVIFVGPSEEESKMVKLRNMETGAEETTQLSDVISLIKSRVRS
jgi:histidyl-tRNA synthetase